MKIFKYNIKNSKPILLKVKKKATGGDIKYLPSFSKEWKNTIYSYNKNVLKNTPMNNLNTNKIIQSYFNLYFKDHQYIDNNPYIAVRKRRNFLRKIYVSDAETKYTNNKAIITLYTVNKEKNNLTKKYLAMNKILSKKLIKRYFSLYKNNIIKIYNMLINNKYLFVKDIVGKKNFILYKLAYLNKFLDLKNLYSRKIWSIILNKYSVVYLDTLRKYHLMYSLNNYKFNKLILLPKLSNILTKLIGKKVEYNIINLKSIAYNTDLFTSALSLKLRKFKANYMKDVLSILNRAPLPLTNDVDERALIRTNQSLFLNQYKDLKVISHLGLSSNEKFTELLNTIYNSNNENKDIHTTIYNSIHYKNIGGIRIELKGRLTKRYRADRAIHFAKWKGGLKNIDSSSKRWSAALFRGNTTSNTSYSLSTSKRRIGAFAVKGWIGGK